MVLQVSVAPYISVCYLNGSFKQLEWMNVTRCFSLERHFLQFTNVTHSFKKVLFKHYNFVGVGSRSIRDTRTKYYLRERTPTY